jgi:putative membrane protein
MKKVILALLAFSLANADLIFAHGYGEDYGMGPWMMRWGHGLGWLWPIFMIIFFIVMIIGIIMLIRWAVVSGSGRQGTTSGDSALESLRLRYAKGEIDKDEFEEKKKILES